MDIEVWVVYECLYVLLCLWLCLCAFLCVPAHTVWAYVAVFLFERHCLRVCVPVHTQTHITVLSYHHVVLVLEGNLSQGSLCGGQAD